MTLKTRLVKLPSERQELFDILQRNFPVQTCPWHDAVRFDWLYLGNPAGTAWSWFAYEEATEKKVGVASVFPQAMWVGGEIKICGLVGDFAIDSGYRSLGPALMLQRATFEPVNQGVLAFCYDCPPNDRGMSTFRRLGMEANCQIHRYVRPLKTNRKLRKYLGQGRWVVPVAALGNFLLNLHMSRRRTTAGVEISLHQDRFAEEFTWLDQQVGGADGIRARRRAEDLNWRYRDDPLHPYHVWTARRRGELVGFAIFSVSSQTAWLVDLFVTGASDIGLQLLEAGIAWLQKEPVQTLYTLITENSDSSHLHVSHLLHKIRFRYRSQAAQVVAYGKVGSEARALLNTQPQWSLTTAAVSAFPRGVH